MPGSATLLEPFFAKNPDIQYSIKRILADGNLVGAGEVGERQYDVLM